MPLSPERKKEIEDEEKKTFLIKKESDDEAAYRRKVRANLESGGLMGSLITQGKKAIKDVLK